MPRRQLELLKDNFYHIFSRGNYKSTVFFSIKDYERFLDKLKTYKDEFKVEIISFSLQSNHFHLTAKPRTDDRIENLMKNLLSSHSHYLSTKYSQQGHLFQSRFKAKLISDEASFLQLFRYIALQPIKDIILTPHFIRKGNSRNLKWSTELIRKLRNFPWGSYREYLDPGEDDITSKEDVFGLLKTRREVVSFVESKVTLDDIIGIDAIENLSQRYQDPGS
jgi:REP element-mobilizing transposase RayT